MGGLFWAPCLGRPEFYGFYGFYGFIESMIFDEMTVNSLNSCHLRGTSRKSLSILRILRILAFLLQKTPPRRSVCRVGTNDRVSAPETSLVH